MVLACLDTSVLIESWRNRYPPDIAPDFWEALDAELRAGTALIADEVLVELERKLDDLHTWLAKRESLLIPPTPDVQEALSRVLARYRKILDTRTNKNRADPIVVATAIVRRATVITEEKHEAAPENRPNIATLCDGFGVPHKSVVDFMRDRQWRMSIARNSKPLR